ncbi:MAG: hypothetical protein MUE61_03690 [Vicinamibacterales bacterium]|jgi:hypothetical protein|nr:hypothetical protein [Vicinamibacterales bacterium]
MRQAITFALFVAFTAVAAAQSPADGKWTFTMDSQMGQVAGQVDLKADGGKLTGTFTLDGGRTLQITNGTVSGSDLAFDLVRDRPSGGTMTYNMAGKLDGDTINGVARTDMGGQTVELPWVMKRVK